MKFKASILLLAFTTTSAFAECDFTVGEAIEPLEPRQVFSFINERELERDAFENSSEHESRVKDALDEILPQSQSIAIFTNRDQYFYGTPTRTFNYDVNNERILYTDYFFSNSATFSDDALLGNGLISDADERNDTGFRSIALLEQHSEDELGVYDKIRNVLSLAEINNTIMRRDNLFVTEVSAEMPSIGGRGVEVTDVMTFDLPRDESREMFADIQSVVSLTLTAPFIIRHDDYLPRDWENDSVKVISYHLIGEINCGLIVSPTGIILDIAEVR
jgi:hypothetical protein